MANRKIDEEPTEEARYHHSIELVLARIIVVTLILGLLIWFLIRVLA